jgi:hypothetical protein
MVLNPLSDWLRAGPSCNISHEHLTEVKEILINLVTNRNYWWIAHAFRLFALGVAAKNLSQKCVIFEVYKKLRDRQTRVANTRDSCAI